MCESGGPQVSSTRRDERRKTKNLTTHSREHEHNASSHAHIMQFHTHMQYDFDMNCTRVLSQEQPHLGGSKSTFTFNFAVYNRSGAIAEGECAIDLTLTLTGLRGVALTK